jgi:hypothetical protein
MFSGTLEASAENKPKLLISGWYKFDKKTIHITWMYGFWLPHLYLQTHLQIYCGSFFSFLPLFFKTKHFLCYHLLTCTHSFQYIPFFNTYKHMFLDYKRQQKISQSYWFLVDTNLIKKQSTLHGWGISQNIDDDDNNWFVASGLSFHNAFSSS